MSASPLRADMLSICISVCKVPEADLSQLVDHLIGKVTAAARATSVQLVSDGECLQDQVRDGIGM